MNVSELMNHRVRSCGLHDNLQHAAQIMWENDCGCVPVVDMNQRVVGMLTDRDICIAGYTQGKLYADIPILTAMAKQVFGVAENDLVETAEALMREKQVRRLPVMDAGGRLRGILSLNDLARHTHKTDGGRTSDLSGDAIAQVLAEICEPRAPKSKQEPVATAEKTA